MLGLEETKETCVQLFLVPAHPGYSGLKGRKMVVVVVAVCGDR